MSDASAPSPASPSSPAWVRLPWGHTGAWFTIAVDSIGRADGDLSYTGSPETVIEGEVVAKSKGAEVRIGDRGQWRVTDAEWTEALRELLSALNPAHREVLGTLDAAFADRVHVKVTAEGAGVRVQDTRPEGLIVDVLPAAGGGWRLDPSVSPVDLRDIGAEPESSHTPESIAAARKSYADPNVDPAEWEHAREVLLDAGALPGHDPA